VNIFSSLLNKMNKHKEHKKHPFGVIAST